MLLFCLFMFACKRKGPYHRSEGPKYKCMWMPSHKSGIIMTLIIISGSCCFMDLKNMVKKTVPL
jgi:hypothetical protein